MRNKAFEIASDRDRNENNPKCLKTFNTSEIPLSFRA